MVSQFRLPQFPAHKHLLRLDCDPSDIMILTIRILTNQYHMHKEINPSDEGKGKIYLYYIISFYVINTAFQLQCTLFFISCVLR